ncbi:MAG: hypothetical protein H7067_18485 [Burkholderiales bacterium]|nr:hypothetical protein [Opitutaceae bacterium]
MKTPFLNWCRFALTFLGAGLVAQAQTPPTNPYLGYLNWWARSNTTLTGPVPEIPKPLITSGNAFNPWDLEPNLRYALSLTWAATSPASTATAANKAVMLARIEQVLDNTFVHLDPVMRRWWWPGAPNRTQGDPNIDRFILLSLGDILLHAETANLFPTKRADWLARLQLAIEFQLENYGANSALDWSTAAAGEYANMDAACVLLLGLGAKLYPARAAAYLACADSLLASLARRVTPDGSTRYWFRSNEVVHYYNYVVMWVSRFDALHPTRTNDDNLLLERASRYLPLALGNLSYLTGNFTHSSRIEVKYLDVWWKFGIDGQAGFICPAEVLAPVADIAAYFAPVGSTARAQNKWIADRLVYTTTGGINSGGHWNISFANCSYYALDRWSSAIVPQPVEAAEKIIRQRLHHGTGVSWGASNPTGEEGFSTGFTGRFTVPGGRIFAWTASLGERQRTLGAAWLMNAADLVRDTTLQMVMPEVRLSAGTVGQPLREVSAYHAVTQPAPAGYTASTALAGAIVTAADFAVAGARYRPARPWITGGPAAPAAFDVRQLALYTPTHVVTFIEIMSAVAQSVPYTAVRIRSDRTPANPNTVNLAIETPGDALGVGRVYAIGGLRHHVLLNTFPTLTHGAAVKDTADNQNHHALSDEFVLRRGTTDEPAATTTAFSVGATDRALIATQPEGLAPASAGAAVTGIPGFTAFRVVVGAHRYHVFINRGGATASITNHDFSPNPYDDAVLYSSRRGELDGHTVTVPLAGTVLTETGIPPGGVVVVRVRN